MVGMDFSFSGLRYSPLTVTRCDESNPPLANGSHILQENRTIAGISCLRIGTLQQLAPIKASCCPEAAFAQSYVYGDILTAAAA